MLASFVGGLGGRDISAEEFYAIAREMREALDNGVAPQPRLLYTATELRQLRKLQTIALAERHEVGGRK
jgi:pyruvate ferredoxin oxidoreductase alpha subunit